LESPASKPLTGNDLVAATRPFAKEKRAHSWFHLATTFALLISLLGCAAYLPWSLWPLRVFAGLAGALVMVRAFIIYHDFQHGAILRGSLLAKAVLYPFGMLFFMGPKYWRETHNFHHAHVSTFSHSAPGSFPILTVEMYRKSTWGQRLNYAIMRHPLTILLAYITVFLFSHGIEPFVKQPLKHWSAGVALLVHGGLIATLWLTGGWDAALLGFILPYAFSAALGAYMFYAQHNFRGVKVLGEQEWSVTEAALKSSSYMKLPRILDWLTGSIGFHHIHHVNSTIPFYRLREAMAAIPELQQPLVTTLRPSDVIHSLRLKVWDPAQSRMISFREARRAA